MGKWPTLFRGRGDSPGGEQSSHLFVWRRWADPIIMCVRREAVNVRGDKASVSWQTGGIKIFKRGVKV